MNPKALRLRDKTLTPRKTKMTTENSNHLKMYLLLKIRVFSIAMLFSFGGNRDTCGQFTTKKVYLMKTFHCLNPIFFSGRFLGMD